MRSSTSTQRNVSVAGPAERCLRLRHCAGNANKSRIVEAGNFLKFSQSASHHQHSNPEPPPDATLKSLLLQTKARELVEASQYDRVWGIGFSIEDAPTSKRSEWGENLLGKAVMSVRARLRDSDGL